MKRFYQQLLGAAVILSVAIFTSSNDFDKKEITSEKTFADPLPSWNEGTTKKAILDFVSSVTTEGGSSFVKPEDRIATFDNDGTLWAEQPMYFQLLFAIDRIKAMAKNDWKKIFAAN